MQRKNRSHPLIGRRHFFLERFVVVLTKPHKSQNFEPQFVDNLLDGSQLHETRKPAGMAERIPKNFSFEGVIYKKVLEACEKRGESADGLSVVQLSRGITHIAHKFPGERFVLADRSHTQIASSQKSIAALRTRRKKSHAEILGDFFIGKRTVWV